MEATIEKLRRQAVMANRPGLVVSDEEYNKLMDEAVDQHRNLPPHMFVTYRSLTERLENFIKTLLMTTELTSPCSGYVLSHLLWPLFT